MFSSPFLSIRFGIALLGLILASTTAYAQNSDHTVGASHIKQAAPTAAPLNPFEAALKFKQQGDYDKAIELLEPEAKQGHGFELAQMILGQCYIALAEKTPAPEVATDAARKGGAWIEQAAASGLPSAQEQMARISIEGGRFKVEPVEAGKWYWLWKGNPARFQAVGTSFDPKLEQRLKATLTDAQWEKARQAAIVFAQKAMPLR